jgi:hypothetical protein
MPGENSAKKEICLRLSGEARVNLPAPVKRRRAAGPSSPLYQAR